MRSVPCSWLITLFETRVPRRVPHGEQEPLTISEHLSSCCQIICLHFFSSLVCGPLRFRVKRCSIRLFHMFGRGYMLYLCYLYLFTYTGLHHDFHIRGCSCSLTITLKCSTYGAGAADPSWHLRSPMVFSGVPVARYLDFCVL